LTQIYNTLENSTHLSKTYKTLHIFTTLNQSLQHFTQLDQVVQSSITLYNGLQHFYKTKTFQHVCKNKSLQTHKRKFPTLYQDFITLDRTLQNFTTLYKTLNNWSEFITCCTKIVQNCATLCHTVKNNFNKSYTTFSKLHKILQNTLHNFTKNKQTYKVFFFHKLNNTSHICTTRFLTEQKSAKLYTTLHNLQTQTTIHNTWHNSIKLYNDIHDFTELQNSTKLYNTSTKLDINLQRYTQLYKISLQNSTQLYTTLTTLHTTFTKLDKT